MKIVVDYISQIDDETEGYRDSLIKLFTKVNGVKVYVLYKGKKPRINNVSFVKKGLNHIKPDAVIVFDLISKKICLEYDTYVYVDNLIRVRADGKIDRIAKKLIDQLDSYRGILVRTGYLKLYLANHYGINKNKILVTSQGFEERFRDENIPKELRDVRRTLTQYGIAKPYVFMFGRLHENINIEGVFEAFSKIHYKFPDLKLLIASPDFKIGWDNKPQPLNKKALDILELCNTYKINRKVIFTGFIDREHLPMVIANAEICLIIHENPKFSRSLTEAMATGVPIIISDSPVLKEIASNSAVVANPKVPDSISEAMTMILSEEEERNKLKLKALARSLTFDWERTVEKIREFIVLNNKNRPKPELLYVKDDLASLDEISEKMSILSNFYKVNESTVYKHKRIMNFNRFKCVYVGSVKFSLNNLLIALLKVFSKRTQVIGEVGEDFVFPEKFRKYGYILYLRMTFDRFVTDNPVAKTRLVRELKVSDKKVDEFPVYITQELAKSDSLKFKQKHKLKNYIPITVRINSAEEFDQLKGALSELLENTKEAKLMVITKLKGLNLKDFSDNIAKKIFILKEEDQIEALQNSRIYLNLRTDISQKEILTAMRLKNVILISRNNNAKYLVKEGINGYLFKHGEFNKVTPQILTLLKNKKHLSDMQKINMLKASSYTKENTLNKFKLVIKNW